MSEVEILDITAANLEVVAAFMSNYATHVGIYLSLAFAYCAAAYVAGNKLTTFQVILATAMFVGAAELHAMSMITWVSAARDMLETTAQINPQIMERQQSQSMTVWTRAFGITVWQVGILGCLFFMWSVRRSKNK